MHGVGGRISHPGHDVRVGVQRCRYGDVTQKLLDELRADAKRQEQRRAGVQQIVKAHVRKLSPPRPSDLQLPGFAPWAQGIGESIVIASSQLLYLPFYLVQYSPDALFQPRPPMGSKLLHRKVDRI